MLSQSKRDQVVNQISTGYIFYRYKGDKLKIKCPTISILHEANFLKEEIIEEIKYDDWLSDTQVEFILFHLKQLPLDYKKRIEDIKKEIENTKLKLYLEKFNLQKEKLLRQSIRDLEAKLFKYTEPFYNYRPFTLDGYAELCKSDYVVMECVEDLKGNKILAQDNSFFLFSSIVDYINKYEIDVATFRELARSEPWRSYWCCYKDNIFQRPIGDWTEHQRYLVMFSRMYDNVYEHPECPPDRVVEDDDKLDGFFIFHRRKSQREKSQAYSDMDATGAISPSSQKKKKDGDMVFIMANNEEEKDMVDNLNSPEAQMIKQQRLEQIKKKGRVHEHEFKDRQMQLHQEANRQFKNKFK